MEHMKAEGKACQEEDNTLVGIDKDSKAGEVMEVNHTHKVV